uniref:Secreted protein n=1 Tax=Pyxicephalus adspersus TaxID=30357 RepID=A0AAV2ZVQ4_PYXAD|nr:TPA: hypothetical protein GDO54_016728 [Pyxicephalus adspersus]
MMHCHPSILILWHLTWHCDITHTSSTLPLIFLSLPIHFPSYRVNAVTCTSLPFYFVPVRMMYQREICSSFYLFLFFPYYTDTANTSEP